VIFVLFSIACQSSSSNTSASPPDGTQARPASSATRLAPTNSRTEPAGPSEEVHATEPRIQITEVPSKGAGPDALETIAGKVSGVKGTECKVVIFAGTDIWYVQPYINSSDTSISEDGTWRTDTHLGNRYAALLVKSSYKPPTTTGKLPAVGGAVLAIATVDAKQ
jgi:hypothetical protein